MKGVRYSISIRIMALTMGAVVICVLALGTISILSTLRQGERDSIEKMRLLCDNCSRTLGSYLNGIEQSEDMITRYAAEALQSVKLYEGGAIGADGLSGRARTVENVRRQVELDEYLHDYIRQMEDVFCSVANRTNGVVSFYFRINPEVSDSEQGFLYSRIGNDSFVRMPLTRLDRYDADDIEHTAWYYVPIQRGYPSWLEPYDNKNLGLRMMSYVSPLYKAGTLVGVIGMDISYETLVGQIREIQLYDTGFAFLTKTDGTVVFHPHLEAGTNVLGMGASVPESIETLAQDSNEEPLRIVAAGEERQMFFNTLSSGLKLFVSVPVREINSNGRTLALRLSCVSVIILVVFSALAALRTHWLTEPLKRLTSAAKDLAEGDYDVQLNYAGDDEIGVLTRAFQQLVEHLRVYISDLNSKAYQDAMTGVRNKGAYAIAAKKLDDAIRIAEPDGMPRFALVMFDCNNLKTINDTYGHEKGDEYLRTACRLICDVFVHSQVFRVGGDEFVALLQGDTYERRNELIAEFGRRAARINEKAQDPWEFANIAKGLAAFEPGMDKDSESVLRRADERMYADKKQSKKAPQHRRLGPQWE